MTAHVRAEQVRTARPAAPHLRLASETTETRSAAIRRRMTEAKTEAATAAAEFVADLDRLRAVALDLAEVGPALPVGVIELLKKFGESAQGTSGNIQHIMKRQDVAGA